MNDERIKTSEKLKGFFYVFILLMVIWLCLTTSLRYDELFTGVLISFLLAVFLIGTYVGLGFPAFTLRRFFYFILYILVLIKEVIKANFDVAYRVLSPKMPIKPGIVVIRTHLQQDMAKLILANSITLTPGTFTLDIIGDRLLIHWINVESDDMERATEIIGRKFEKYLVEIFK